MTQTLFNVQDIFNELNGSGKRTKLGVGKHDAVSLVEVDLGENYIDFIFEKEGLGANKRLYFPDIDHVYPKQDINGVEETKEQALYRSTKEVMAHIIKIMHIFLGEDVIKTFNQSSLPDLAKRAASMLNAAKNATKVNLLLIYDSEGIYPTFGRFPNYIEEHVPGVPNSLEPSKWELENRMTKADNTSDTLKESNNSLSNLY